MDVLNTADEVNADYSVNFCKQGISAVGSSLIMNVQKRSNEMEERHSRSQKGKPPCINIFPVRDRHIGIKPVPVSQSIQFNFTYRRIRV
jgi:hypothetical protein